jgi:transcriptional regulator with XRE-family HTH domain
MPKPKRVKPFEACNPGAEPISDVLRRAIEKQGSRYELSKKSGVAESVISRFVNRKATLNLVTADRLANRLTVKVRTVDVVKLRDSLKGIVKSWYREKSRQYHPDHGGSTKAQAILNECKKDFLARISRLDFGIVSESKVHERSEWEMMRAGELDDDDV